jgi:hypothetical protein
MRLLNDGLLEHKITMQKCASFDRRMERHKSQIGRLFITMILPVELFIFSSEAMLKFYCKNCVTFVIYPWCWQANVNTFMYLLSSHIARSYSVGYLPS